jgi:HD-GYP domain-containing protein (c-di-GMP phosphodiesterase class II)
MNDPKQVVLDPQSSEIYANAFLQSFFQFLKLAELHDRENAIFEESLKRVQNTLETFVSVPGTDGLELTFRGEHIFINRIRLRPRPRQFYVYRYFLRFMRRKGLGSIHFHSLPTAEQILFFLWRLAEAQPGPESLSVAPLVESQLKGQGIRSVSVKPQSRLQRGEGSSGDEDGLDDIELATSLVYRELHRWVTVVLENRAAAQKFDLKPLEQLLNDLSLLSEEDLVHMLRLASVKRYSQVLPYRAVNSAVLMAAWGHSLKLPRGVVMELAGTGLLHALTLTSQGSFDSEITHEKILINLQELEGIWPATDLQALALMEWNQSFGNEGLVKVGESQCYLHFFSRMLRIVSDFDRFTTYTVESQAQLPDEALSSMIKTKGVYDPTLLKLFINWLGLYPVGTLVQLNTSEIAQVFSGSSDPTQFQRPMVLLLTDSRGQPLPRPEVFDLTTLNEKVGTYRKSIRRSVRREELKLPDELFKMTPVGI